MEKNKEALEKKKGIFIFLIVLIVLLFILSIILYFNGIEKVLPIIFFLILPIIVALIIFLLSKNVWINSYQKKKRKIVSKKNA